MEELTQTISNLVGILLGVVGAVGVGFFIYGAYMYLTASGAPHQMERGKSAMMTALAGIVLGDGGLRRRRAGDERRGGQPGGPQPARPVHANAQVQRVSRTNGRRESMREHEVPTHVQAETGCCCGSPSRRSWR